VTGAGHQPERPGWTCAACGEPWPCPDRRASMMAGTWTAVLRGLTMARYFPDALADRPPVEAGALWRRMFLWIR
jgi:hypothetical protein